jgi:hypothetical protein
MSDGWTEMNHILRTNSDLFHFPHDKNRDGSHKVSSLAIKPPDVAASLRKLYWIHCCPLIVI